MIFIEVEEPDTDEWRSWREECDAETALLIDNYEIGTKPNIRDLYKGQKREFYFYGKCVRVCRHLVCLALRGVWGGCICVCITMCCVHIVYLWNLS